MYFTQGNHLLDFHMHEAGHPKPVFGNNLENVGRKGEREVGSLRMFGAHVYLWLINADVWQKPSHYCILSN